MVSYQGTYEFFDNAFTYPENVLRPRPLIKTYPEHSVMWYLERFHPKYAFIVKLARLDWQMADASFRGTLFVPLEDSLNENEILQMDISTARRIVKYQFMVGLFPKDVLYTSPYQQLQSTIKGAYITASIQRPGEMVLNYTTPIVFYDILLTNGIIHIISKMLILA